MQNRRQICEASDVPSSNILIWYIVTAPSEPLLYPLDITFWLIEADVDEPHEKACGRGGSDDGEYSIACKRGLDGKALVPLDIFLRSTNYFSTGSNRCTSGIGLVDSLRNRIGV